MKRCLLSLAIVMMSLPVAARADHDQDLHDQTRTIEHQMYVKVPASDSHTITLEKPVQAQQVHVTIVHKTSGIVVDAVPVSHHY